MLPRLRRNNSSVEPALKIAQRSRLSYGIVITSPPAAGAYLSGAMRICTHGSYETRQGDSLPHIAENSSPDQLL
jgi:hypothetical protein